MENIRETSIHYGKEAEKPKPEAMPAHTDAAADTIAPSENLPDTLDKNVTDTIIVKDVVIHKQVPKRTIAEGERNKKETSLNEHTYEEIMALYHSPAFRMKYEQYRDYDYGSLFHETCEDVKKGRVTLDKLKVKSVLLFITVLLLKCATALLKFLSPRTCETRAALLKDLICIIRMEDAMGHIKKVIGVYARVIQTVPKQLRVATT